MTRTFLEVRAYENIRTRHKRTHLYADMMAKMALRRNALLLLAAGRANALLCLSFDMDCIIDLFKWAVNSQVTYYSIRVLGANEKT